MSKQIPVTIVTGFLGAGKTTLINKVLKEKHNEHIAVIINEFGEVGVDHQFVLDVEEEIYQMDNGCLCCTLRTDIADMLKTILTVKEKNGIKVDRILFETTGIADPAPIAQTFINVPFLNEHFIVDAVLSLVDAQNFLNHSQHQPEPVKQVGFADKLFISKHSTVSDDVFKQVIEEVRSINAFAPIQDLDERPVELSDMFDLHLFYASEAKILEMEKNARMEEESVCCIHGHDHENCDCHHEHTCKDAHCGCDHDHNCAEEDCNCSHHHTCSDTDCKCSHDHHCHEESDCHCDHEHTCKDAHCGCDHDHNCAEEDCGCNHEHTCADTDCNCKHHHNCHHAHHHSHKHHHRHHHSGINSFVIETHKPLVIDEINEWLNELVYTYGAELYRYKGILNVEGLDYQVIFQGVQMSFDISRGRDWEDTPRQSTLVFIGKNLPEQELRESFLACTEK